MSLGKVGKERMRAVVLLDADQVCPSDLPSRLGLSSRQLRCGRSRGQSSGTLSLVGGRRGNGGSRSRPVDQDRLVSWCRGLTARALPAVLRGGALRRGVRGVDLVGDVSALADGDGSVVGVIASAPVPHPPRPRRSRHDGSVQIDASEHEWVTGYRWVLQVFTDDVTSEILQRGSRGRSRRGRTGGDG